MKRSAGLKPISDKRLAELAQQGVKFPTSTFAPSKPKMATPRQPRRAKETGPDAATVSAVLERDGYQCVVCACGLLGTHGFDYSVHHRKLRSQGGGNRLSNLISVCGHGTAGCHANIHGAPAKAMEAGWIVSREHDPATTLMAHSLYGYVLLNDLGGVIR